MAAPVFGEKPPRVSAGKRRKQEAEAAIERGFHPLRGDRLANNGKTCGDCVFAEPRRLAKTYWKCGKYPWTFGPGTDLRLRWPACVAFVERK